MEINDLSTIYKVKKLTVTDMDLILTLCKGNPLFYEYHPPIATKKSILADMYALPPQSEEKDKYYIGFFNYDHLIAIMDLILGYPNENTVYIGFFMMHSALQGIGLGSKLIEECIVCLSKVGFCNIELAVDKGNPQSRHFWMKRNFKDRDPEYKNKSSDYIPMIRRI